MRIHCKYTGIKGSMIIYRDALRYRYMITEKAQKKAKILAFFEKHGLKTTLEAFEVKKRTLYGWKEKWEKGNKKPEALNEKSRVPRTQRKRIWDERIIQEIKRLRS